MRPVGRVVELLTQMTGDQVTVALTGELDPGLIRPLTGDDYSAWSVAGGR